MPSIWVQRPSPTSTSWSSGQRSGCSSVARRGVAPAALGAVADCDTRYYGESVTRPQSRAWTPRDGLHWLHWTRTERDLDRGQHLLHAEGLLKNGRVPRGAGRAQLLRCIPAHIEDAYFGSLLGGRLCQLEPARAG